MSKPLSELFTLYGSDKARFDHDKQGHSYGPVYDKLLTPRRDSLTAVLEVGVLGGSSIRAWREWLPDACRVVGIDHTLMCGEIAGAELYTADSMKPESVDVALGASTFDLIVDDGGHALHEQQATWETLLPRLWPGRSLYIVEDLQSIEAQEWFAEQGCEIISHNHRTGKWDDVLAVLDRGM